jgi:hypothetical protein
MKKSTIAGERVSAMKLPLKPMTREKRLLASTRDTPEVPDRQEVQQKH